MAMILYYTVGVDTNMANYRASRIRNMGSMGLAQSRLISASQGGPWIRHRQMGGGTWLRSIHGLDDQNTPIPFKEVPKLREAERLKEPQETVAVIPSGPSPAFR